MFTVFRNTSEPTLRKPERESKRGMTNQVEGYRLESATFRVYPSKVSRYSSFPTTRALGRADSPQTAILTNLLVSSNQNLTFLPRIGVNSETIVL